MHLYIFNIWLKFPCSQELNNTAELVSHNIATGSDQKQTTLVLTYKDAEVTSGKFINNCLINTKRNTHSYMLLFLQKVDVQCDAYIPF